MPAASQSTTYLYATPEVAYLTDTITTVTNHLYVTPQKAYEAPTGASITTTSLYATPQFAYDPPLNFKASEIYFINPVLNELPTDKVDAALYASPKDPILNIANIDKTKMSVTPGMVSSLAIRVNMQINATQLPKTTTKLRT